MGRRGEDTAAGGDALNGGAVKEQLVALLGDRVGLDQSKASQAVDTIMNFIKENPEKLTEFLGEDPMETVTDTIGKLFGR